MASLSTLHVLTDEMAVPCASKVVINLAVGKQAIIVNKREVGSPVVTIPAGSKMAGFHTGKWWQFNASNNDETNIGPADVEFRLKDANSPVIFNNLYTTVGDLVQAKREQDSCGESDLLNKVCRYVGRWPSPQPWHRPPPHPPPPAPSLAPSPRPAPPQSPILPTSWVRSHSARMLVGSP